MHQGKHNPIQDTQTHRETINCLAVLAPNNSILYIGGRAACYNYMLNNPCTWRQLVYALRRSSTIETYGPADLRLAELRLQYEKNLSRLLPTV